MSAHSWCGASTRTRSPTHSDKGRDLAARLSPPLFRSLDALHVVTAVRAGVAVLVTYDGRMNPSRGGSRDGHRRAGSGTGDLDGQAPRRPGAGLSRARAAEELTSD